jgi:hypothetical protein
LPHVLAEYCVDSVTRVNFTVALNSFTQSAPVQNNDSDWISDMHLGVLLRSMVVFMFS